MRAGKPHRRSATPSREKGDQRAQHNVAVIYDSGRGVPPNPVEARKWYERAAAKGLPASQNNLGMLFSKGRGTQPDQARAVELWTAAARQGYSLAEFNLGLAYANGQGVERDMDRARELFQSAATKKLPDSASHGCSSVEPESTGDAACPNGLLNGPSGRRQRSLPSWV